MKSKDPTLWLAFAGLLLGVIVAGIAAQFSPDRSIPKDTTPVSATAEVPANRGLDANLYMQTAAEYRAICYQTFHWAESALKLHLQQLGKPSKPLAVVLDLDETVLDNRVFQTEQLLGNYAYDQKRWDDWEANQADKVRLIPGAKEFIQRTKELGVRVCFISNRNEKSRASTLSALNRLGLAIQDPIELQLVTTTSDKTARRANLEKQFEVVLLIGDNLRDFAESYRFPKVDKTTASLKSAIATRDQNVDRDQKLFGTRYILLPNPAYGEWKKAFERGDQDLELLDRQ